MSCSTRSTASLAKTARCRAWLDLMGIPYTHSGLVTSVIAIDKELTKQRLVPHGIPMPTGTIVTSESLHTADPLPRPYVLETGQRRLIGRGRHRPRR